MRRIETLPPTVAAHQEGMIAQVSLDDTVQDLADRLGKPLVVLDRDLKVAGYSVHDTDVRRARLAGLLAGSETPLTEAVVNENQLKAALRPVRIVVGEPDEVLVVLALRHEKRLFGYLYFVAGPTGQEGTDSDELRLLESAGPEIGTLLALRESDRRRSIDYSKRLLSGLLGGSTEERSRSAEALLREDLIEDVEHYSVLVFRSLASSPRSLTQLAVKATLEFTARSTTVKILGAVLGAEGIVLFPRTINRSRLEQALARPGLDQVNAGAGSTKNSLTEAVDSYQEAQIACRAAFLDPKRYGTQVFWDDLGIERILLQLPLEQLRPSHLPVGVSRLLASPNSQELMATLENYLECGGEIQKTARRLSIHRSTLYYRLDRIRELTGCDISDGLIRLDLHAGLRVARLAGLWPSG